MIVRMQNDGRDWSPVDDRIAFSSGGTLWIAHAFGATPPVPVAKGFSWELRWAPDGKTLFSAVTRGGARVVVSIADDGTHERRLTNFSGRRGSIGNLATDGTYLYFTWDEDIGDLWVMDVVEAGK